ncbi:MAG: DUF2252 domain-containing protein [Chloroflexi bacterium]|nr:DUF2252 domain-containing protein [Chloroflexota bacterium]
MSSTHVPHPVEETRTERRARGKALRQQTLRTSHSGWQPAANRPDPLALLRQQDEGRLQHLLPIKYGRMLASPFAFFRGSAVVMAADLAHTPVSGLDVMLCGDAHLSNFGLFASPERNLMFDINDFDECYPGPWEWDLKRLAASVAIAGRGNGFSNSTNRDMAEDVAHVYRKAMRRLSKARTLDVWYFHVDAAALQAIYDKYASKKAIKATDKAIKKAMSRTQERTIGKLTVVEDGRRRIKSNPPLLVPLRADNLAQFVDADDLAQISEAAVTDSWNQYLQSLETEKRFLLSRYRIVDAALRVGGVGSVGTRCIIILLQGGAHDDSLILQLKEAGPSALAAYLPLRHYEQQAQRVVIGQQLMQATTDIFLGWHRSEVSGNDFYWRQLKDMKGSADVEKMDKAGLKMYVDVCALCLARTHARTGDAAAISGYLGKSGRFDKAIGAFALAYADQAERDYEGLVAAVKNGQLAAETGI